MCDPRGARTETRRRSSFQTRLYYCVRDGRLSEGQIPQTSFEVSQSAPTSSPLLQIRRERNGEGGRDGTELHSRLPLLHVDQDLQRLLVVKPERDMTLVQVPGGFGATVFLDHSGGGRVQVRVTSGYGHVSCVTV